MFGSTPPCAIVTSPRYFENSSSRRTASCMCRGVMRERLLSRAAFPASSTDSATRYSSTAAKYTGAAPPTRFAKFPDLSNRPTRDTGKISPAFALFVFPPVAFLPLAFAAPPFPFPDIVALVRISECLSMYWKRIKVIRQLRRSQMYGELVNC